MKRFHAGASLLFFFSLALHAADDRSALAPVMSHGRVGPEIPLLPGARAAVAATRSRPLVASNGIDFAVVWQQTGTLCAVRYSATGELLDDDPFVLGNAIEKPVWLLWNEEKYVGVFQNPALPRVTPSYSSVRFDEAGFSTPATLMGVTNPVSVLQLNDS